MAPPWGRHVLTYTYVEKTFKNLLIWNQKAWAFDSWYIASPSGPLPRLFYIEQKAIGDD